MPWCPKCKTEYREGFETCADCGETLTVQAQDAAIRLSALSRLRQMIETALLGVPAWIAAYYAFGIVVGVFNAVSPEHLTRAQGLNWWILTMAVLFGVPSLFGFTYGRFRSRPPDTLGVFLGWLIATIVLPPMLGSWTLGEFAFFLANALAASGATLLGFREWSRQVR